MKRIVVLVLFVFLVTGCSVEYHLDINEDLTIIEQAKLTGTKDFFDSYYKTTKTNVLKSYLDIYGNTLEENNYTYKLEQGDTPYVSVSKKFDSINNYTENSILLSNYFEEVKYIENGNIKRIETSGYDKGTSDDNRDRFYLSELTISITCPFKVKENNAKRVNENTNTYYFELSDDGDKIILEFDASRKFNPQSKTIRTILAMIGIIIASWVTVIILNKKNK